MASQAECDEALRGLAKALAEVDPDIRRRYVLDRTVACRVPDIGVTWTAHLTDEGLVNISTAPDQKSQLRVTVASDDLIALTEGRLAVASAVATGKIRIQASPFDLLRLSSFL